VYLGDVIGRVVSTAKNETLDGRILLLVRRLSDQRTVVAIDSVGAGTGERVYVCRGKESSFAFLPDRAPSDATIVGIVDRVGNVTVGNVSVGDVDSAKGAEAVS
jgi:microcompartment protein CcmK/EutM